MDLNLSEDQELFLGSTERFLRERWSMGGVRGLSDVVDGFDRSVWSQGAELGWVSLLVPEEFGGGGVSDAGVVDLSIVAEVLGKFLVPGPVLATNIGVLALCELGSAGLLGEHLPRVVSGDEILGWAVPEGGVRWGADAGGVVGVASGDGFVLSGVKWPVQDALVADFFVVSALVDGGLSLFLVDANAAGVGVVGLGSLDLARRFGRVEFDGVLVPGSALLGEVGGAAGAVERQLELMVALQCAETVGAVDRAMEMTLEYVKDRRSFGRPIGSYQALKHRLVDMVLWLESSKAATVAAVSAVQFGVGAAEAVSVAKAYMGDRCPAILRECVQMHGGIGYTWEHDLHYFLRRVETNALLFGSADYHRDRLAPVVGL